ncbi:hypothetical protein [Oceanisphaera sp. KMM 10153]|uniref:hypothetical protein n=1 Tax=Oceanisphaera submarina TaxID=3390193 RepID=UPI003975CEFE
MKIRSLEHIRLHLNDLALRHVHAMHCESVQGWTIAVTVYTANDGIDIFTVGQGGELATYPSMISVADALASVGVQQFTVTQQARAAA